MFEDEGKGIRRGSRLTPRTYTEIFRPRVPELLEKAREDFYSLTKEEMAAFLGHALGPKYGNVEYFKEGGTRLLFSADWGPNNQQRVIKVDKPVSSLTSSRAIRHVSRGYTTRNDIMMLSRVREAEAHNIMPVVDYLDLRPFGVENEVLVEPLFHMSKSLEEIIQDKGPVPDGRILRNIFNPVFSACGNFYNCARIILHRDLKPSNILIRTCGKSFEYDWLKYGAEVRVTDFANACFLDETDEKYMPTAGGSVVTDWHLMSPLTGKPARYDEQSEVYAVGRCILYAIRGDHFVQIDPDKRIAIVTDTGESLVGEDGLIEGNKYETALDNAMRSMPWKFRKFRKLLKKALTSELGRRFERTGQMSLDFCR